MRTNSEGYKKKVEVTRAGETIRRFATLKFHDYAASRQFQLIERVGGSSSLSGSRRRDGREAFVRPSRTNGRENEYHLFRNTHPGTDPSAERGILTAGPRLSQVTKFRDLGARDLRTRLRRGTFFSTNARLASLNLVIAVEDEAFIVNTIRANLRSTSFLKGNNVLRSRSERLFHSKSL